jgi:hypothetical protein
MVALGQHAEAAPFVVPSIHAGCPDGYVAPPSDHRPFTLVRPDPVAKPSAYHVHVYLVPDNEADELLGAGVPHRKVTYEVQCANSHVCGGVTTALFLRESLQSDVDAIARGLARATGLSHLLGWEDNPDLEVSKGDKYEP